MTLIISHSSRKENETKYIYGADCIIVEGIYVLLDEKLRSLFDLKLFVDTEDDIRLARRCTCSWFKLARVYPCHVFFFFLTAFLRVLTDF